MKQEQFCQYICIPCLFDLQLLIYLKMDFSNLPKICVIIYIKLYQTLFLISCVSGQVR